MTAPSKPSGFELHWVQQAGSRPAGMLRPATIEEATAALADNPSLRPVAGGTDLLLELARDGRGDEVELLDMTGIAGFAEVTETATGLRIGAGVTHNDIVGSSVFAAAGLIALRQACLEIGSPQLRNRATLVGNVVTASPANDTISALLALDAELELSKSVDGQLITRQVKLEDFYDGFRSTVLEPTEIVTGIDLPRPGADRQTIWVKAGLRKAQAISVVHVGVAIDFAPDKTVQSARIALGSVGPMVALSAPAAEALVGTSLDAAAIQAAATAAIESVTPIDDGRATADYRLASVRTVVSRGLSVLAAGQAGSQWPDRVPVLSVRAARPASNDSAHVQAGAEVSVQVNGAALQAPAVGSGTLLDWLRDTTGTGTKEGCAEGECGACTVQMDGEAVMSCLVPAAQADGSQVVTVEGLAPTGVASAMQQAFVDKFAVQCGYCIPGFIVAAETLAHEFDSVPTREEVELALSGNLCRCTGYYNIIDAVIAAIKGARS